MLNLTKAADIMRRELFEPLGLHPPAVPVGDLSQFAAVLFGMDGGTFYSPDDGHLAEEIKIFQHEGPLETAATLAHEMVHTITGHQEDHGARFEALARQIGLDGPAPNTWAGPAFAEFYNRHLAGIADA